MKGSFLIKCVIALAIGLGSVPVMQGASYRFITYTLADGTAYSIEITPEMKCYNLDGNFVIEKAQESFLLDGSQVASARFEYNSAIESVEATAWHIFIRGRELRCLNGENEHISVFSADGIMVSSAVVDSKDFSLDLSGLASGYYLVRYGDKSLKVLLR